MTLTNRFGENVHIRVKLIISREASETNTSSSSVSKLSLDVKRNLDSETWTCAAMVSAAPGFKWQHLLARCSRLCGVWGRSLWFRLRVLHLIPSAWLMQPLLMLFISHFSGVTKTIWALSLWCWPRHTHFCWSNLQLFLWEACFHSQDCDWK